MIDKSRYWSFIGWVESLSENWKIEIENQNLPVVVSPLHDRDVEENGEVKKAHYHILVCWDGPVTLNNARQFGEQIGLGTYVERVRSIKNILDYMTHNSYSSKDKHKYDYREITWINCKENDFVKSEFKQIINYIKSKNIKQIHKLVDSLITDNEDDLLMYLSKNTYYVYSYLCSLKTDYDIEIKSAYNMLKGIADSLDERGRFTLDRKNYCKLLEVFEQLDIWCQ